ncbi:MAG TPA: dockerin type I domain-containing protein [Clostridia bacterium]
MKRKCLISSALALLLVTSGIFQVSSYAAISGYPSVRLSSLSDIDTLNSSYSCASSVNNKGQIVGQIYPSGYLSRSFLYEGSSLKLLDTTSGDSAANSINDDGQIVGWSTLSDGSKSSYIIDKGTYANLHGPILDSLISEQCANFINNKGQIAGYFIADSLYRPLLWNNASSFQIPGNRIEFLNSVNSKGIAVGQFTNEKGENHACILNNEKITDLGTLGGKESCALDINDSDQVVGYSSTADGKSHAFLWDNGKLTDLGTLGGDSSSALAINNKGEIVGSSTTASGETHGFIYRNKELFPIGTLGGNESIAYDINDNGQIVGAALTKNGVTHAFTTTRTVVGDLNSDNLINSTDLALMKRYILGITNNINVPAADINGDDKINSADYNLLKRQIILPITL